MRLNELAKLMRTAGDENRLKILCIIFNEDKVCVSDIAKKLNELGIEPEDAGLKRIPNDTKKLDLESAKKILRLIDTLEDDDDVQNVYHNLEMTDEIAAAFG